MGGKLQGAAELKSSVRREVEAEEIRQEEVETAMHKMKKGKATGADEVWLEMLEMAGEVDRKAAERVYAGGKDTEGVEDRPDSADMEEERGCT